VTSIAEITGLEGDIIQMQEIFKFVRTGTGPDNSVIGHFQATGVRRASSMISSLWASRFPAGYFDPSQTALIRQLRATMSFEVRPHLSDLCLRRGSGRAFVEGIYLLCFSGVSYRQKRQRRLKRSRDEPNRENILVQLRRERGLTGGGDYSIGFEAFNKLLLQSGLTMGASKLLMVVALGALIAFVGRPM